MTGTGRAVRLNVGDNALNLFRLALAGLVLVAHTYFLRGWGAGPSSARAISARGGSTASSPSAVTSSPASRISNTPGRYLLKRVARIFPGFLVCNFVVAALIAPSAWLHSGRSLSEYVQSHHGPLQYVLVNAPLKISFYDIGGGPTGVPIVGTWNGSLWSLYFEFLCYIAIGLIASFALLRRAVPLTLIYLVALAAWVLVERLPNILSSNYQFKTLAELAPWFLGGAAVYAVTRHGSLFPGVAVCAAVAGGGLVAISPHWGPQAAAPLFAYFLLWFATVVPCPRIIQTHDVSYGVYIYAFPMQQLLASFGMADRGLWAFGLSAAILTIGCAVSSWLLVERPAMRRLTRPRKVRPVVKSEPAAG